MIRIRASGFTQTWVWDEGVQWAGWTWGVGVGVTAIVRGDTPLSQAFDKPNSWDSPSPNIHCPHTQMYVTCVCFDACEVVPTRESCVMWKRGREVRDDDVFLPISSSMMRVEQQLCSLSLHVCFHSDNFYILFMKFTLPKYWEKLQYFKDEPVVIPYFFFLSATNSMKRSNVADFRTVSLRPSPLAPTKDGNL